MAWKPIVLLRVSDACIFLKQGEFCIDVPISKVNRVEEDIDPLLGNIHKIYISENNYHMVKEITDNESLDRLKLLFGDKYIERKNRG
jgi:hypothetical protein